VNSERIIGACFLSSEETQERRGKKDDQLSIFSSSCPSDGKRADSRHLTNSCAVKFIPSLRLVAMNASATVNKPRYCEKVGGSVWRKTTGL
jgi:hypothetical protein